MPIPKPRNNEEKEKFISRCMSNETMKKEYKGSDQRFAVCSNQWKKKTKVSKEGKAYM